MGAVAPAPCRCGVDEPCRPEEDESKGAAVEKSRQHAGPAELSFKPCTDAQDEVDATVGAISAHHQLQVGGSSARSGGYVAETPLAASRKRLAQVSSRNLNHGHVGHEVGSQTGHLHAGHGLLGQVGGLNPPALFLGSELLRGSSPQAEATQVTATSMGTIGTWQDPVTFRTVSEPLTFNTSRSIEPAELPHDGAEVMGDGDADGAAGPRGALQPGLPPQPSADEGVSTALSSPRPPSQVDGTRGEGAGAEAQTTADKGCSDETLSVETLLPRGAGSRSPGATRTAPFAPEKLPRSAFGESVDLYLNTQANAALATDQQDDGAPKHARVGDPCRRLGKRVRLDVDRPEEPPHVGLMSPALGTSGSEKSFPSSRSVAATSVSGGGDLGGGSTPVRGRHLVSKAGLLWALQEVHIDDSDPLTMRFFIAMLQPRERARLEQQCPPEVLHVAVTQDMLRPIFGAELSGKAESDDAQEFGDAFSSYDVSKLLSLAQKLGGDGLCSSGTSTVGDNCGRAGVAGAPVAEGSAFEGADRIPATLRLAALTDNNGGPDAAAGVGVASSRSAACSAGSAKRFITKAALKAALLNTQSSGAEQALEKGFDRLGEDVVRRSSFLSLLDEDKDKVVDARPESRSCSKETDDGGGLSNACRAATGSKLPPPVPHRFLDDPYRRRSWPINLKSNPLLLNNGGQPPVINGMPHGIRV